MPVTEHLAAATLAYLRRHVGSALPCEAIGPLMLPNESGIDGA